MILICGQIYDLIMHAIQGLRCNPANIRSRSRSYLIRIISKSAYKTHTINHGISRSLPLSPYGILLQMTRNAKDPAFARLHQDIGSKLNYSEAIQLLQKAIDKYPGFQPEVSKASNRRKNDRLTSFTIFATNLPADSIMQ